MEKRISRPAKVGEIIEIVSATENYCCYKNGDRYIVTDVTKNGGVNFWTGKTDERITFIKGHSYAYLSEYVVIEQVGITDEKHPEIKEGTRFIVVDSYGLNTVCVGDIVTLYQNDNTTVPSFMDKNGREIYLKWGRLALLSAQQSGNTTKPCPYCGLLLEDLTPAKRVFTSDQISEARETTYRLLCDKVWNKDNCDAVHFISFLSGNNSYHNKEDEINRGMPRTLCTINKTYDDENKNRAVAFCNPGYAWNDDIGKLVSLCKLLKEPLPKWLQNK